MQTQILKSGDWYHTVDCSHCGTLVHAFHARKADAERLPGPGLFPVRCPECGYRDLYKPAAFTPRRYTKARDVAGAVPSRGSPPHGTSMGASYVVLHRPSTATRAS